jgi:uncharacterized membrane protein
MPRIQSLDLARGFTVLFLPAIHTVLCYSKPSVYKTGLGYFLAFIAEGPGAQLFMTIMGILFTLKKEQPVKAAGRKSLLLLLAGYGLNTSKFILLFALCLLPKGVQQALQLSGGAMSWWELFSMGDILQFAAIALVIIWLLYKLENYPVYALSMAVFIIFISPLVWDTHSRNISLNYILQLFTGAPPRVFFPEFPWIVYPLIGLAIGHYLQKNETLTYASCRHAGLVCLAAGYIFEQLGHEHEAAGFYRTCPGETLVHIGIVLLTLYLWDWVSRHLHANAFFLILKYMSRHITQIYLIQWTLICWLLPLFGYRDLGLFASVEAIGLTSMASFSLSVFLNRLKRH